MNPKNLIKKDYYNECPLCTNKTIKDKYKHSDYTISECLRCSALFVKEILTKDFLNNYYKKLEGDFVYEENNQKYLDYYYNKIKSEIEKIKPAKGSLLDIGCSSGFFQNKMEGWECHGTEISEKFGNIAKKKLGNKVFIGSFEDYPVKNNYFDVITLQDVFDHFINPFENIKKCYELLKPGGLLIIKVHNISCLYAKMTGANFYAIIPPTHLFYFNKKSLKSIINRAGFTFCKSRFIGHKLQLKTILYRLSKGETNTASYKLFKLTNNNIFGRIVLYKNLRDIVTVFATKQ